MKHQIIIKGLEDLERAAAEFLEKIGDNTLVAFFAPMGAGKTTFTTALCKALGVTDPEHFLHLFFLSKETKNRLPRQTEDGHFVTFFYFLTIFFFCKISIESTDCL